MTVLPEPVSAAGRAGLVALLAEPARALVAVDLDGTLAPIADHPEDVRLAPGALPALARLAATVGTVVILTGRPADVAVRLGGFATAEGLGRLVVLGHYGLERWEAATGQVSRPPPLPGLADARVRVGQLLADRGDPGDSIEDKEHSVAVHTRRAADPDAELGRLREPLRAIAARAGLAVEPGRFVLELRPPGIDKGRALRELVAERASGALLYAGDDLGDLAAYDAVEALRHAGVPGLTVCSESAEPVPAVRQRADLVVAGPAGVVALLDALVAAIGNG